MRFRIGRAVLAGVALSATLSVAARAATVEEFKAEDWDGLAFTSDETGAFTHCSVYASYRNGSTLYISYEAGDSWFFSVANDAWKLAEGGSFAIKFKVDRRGEVEGTGTALGPTQIGLPVEVDHPFVNQLRRGRELVISFQNKDYAFELSNSNKAMNAAQDCVRRHVALGTHTPIMTRKPDTSAPAQESEQAAPQAGEQQQTAAEPPAEQPAEQPSAADSSASSGAEATGERQQFGPWVVTETNDENGKFYNCTAYDVQGDDQIIMSLFPDNAWTFGLYRAGWKLDTNQTYYLWYNVDAPADAASVIKRPVEAAEATRIFFEVSDVEDIIDRMENGTTLNLKFRGLTGAAESYSYPLDQAHAAFEAARKCIADHAAPAEAATPPASGGETVSKEGGTKGQAEATGADDQGTTSGEAPSSDESASTTADSSAPTAGPAEGGNTPQAPLPTLGEKKLEDLTVPGWEAAAYGNTGDGAFTHCSINAEYQNGATLGFALTAGGELLMVVQHKDWKFPAEKSLPISYTLNADTPFSASTQGEAVGDNVVMADLGSEADLANTLKGAHEVTVQAEGKDLSFDTSDVGPALTAIEECVANHAAASAPAPAAKKIPAGKVNPNAASTETPPAEPEAPSPAPAQDQSASTDSAAPADDAALHTEAEGYTTALLLRSGFANTVVNGDDVPEAFRSHRAMWKVKDVVGVTDLVSGSVEEIKQQVFSSDTKDCAGEIATGVDSDAGAYGHIHSVCKNGTSTITVHYLIIPRPAGGSYMLSFIDTGDGSIGEEIASKVYSIVAPT